MKHIRTAFLLASLVILTVACNLPASLSNLNQSSPNAIVQGFSMATVDPNAPATPTPFLPVGSTPTFIPTLVPTAIIPAGAGTGTPVPLIDRLKKPDGQVNILVFGSDYRPGGGYRTDVILLVSLNTIKGTASVVSFPRDLYVNIPGWEMQRVNTAQAHGGFTATVATFQYNFGVTPDFYIMTNFAGFTGIIDTLGGIDIEASQGLTDKCDLPQAVRHYCSIDVGTHHMDGATALWYTRSRHSTSDFDRTRREQEVMQGIFTKLLSLNAVKRGPELWNEFSSSVETNMSVSDVVSLLPLAAKFSDTSKITRYAIGPGQVTSWVTPEGADVLLPNQSAIWDIIKAAVYGQ
jgi:polyisoprenyl-teichoic acid--peptidoglycan teichoic acid transferase